MAKIIRYAPHAARRAARVGAAHSALVREVTEALLQLGGQAHRTLVIQQVGRARGAERAAMPALAEAVIRAFETQRAADGRLRHGRPLFALPFGEGSHRWALDGEAHDALRQRQAG